MRGWYRISRRCQSHISYVDVLLYYHLVLDNTEEIDEHPIDYYNLIVTDIYLGI